LHKNYIYGGVRHVQKKLNTSGKGKSLLTLLAAAFMFFLLAGCATTGMYGTVDRDYELENSAQLWKPVPDIDSNKMKYWLSALHNERYLNKPSRYYAAYILDPNGQRVGVWYSYEALATVRFFEGNKLLVYTPDPFKRYMQ
jgi:hypothetical protein